MVKRNIVIGVAAFLIACFMSVELYVAFMALPDKTCTNIIRINHSLQPSPLEPFKLQDSRLPDCPETPPNLFGPIEAVMDFSLIENEKVYSHLKDGHGQPIDCKARNKVAIIVPFRNRESHLPILLYNLHRMLEKQQTDYSIFVIEQTPDGIFNRAKLLNIGFIEASKLYEWDCFIFHDVDLIPENDKNIYKCAEQPKHLSVAIDTMNYRLPYYDIMGGITAFTSQQMKKINGFSNDYWGWGGEDDDVYKRVYSSGFKRIRDPNHIAKYKAIEHEDDDGNPENDCRHTLLRNTHWRSRCDGLSSCNYEIINATIKPLYIHFLVDLFEEESRERLREEDRIFKKC